jgi:hypothetical protein
MAAAVPPKSRKYFNPSSNSEFPSPGAEIVLWCSVEAGIPRAAAGQNEEIRRDGDGPEFRDTIAPIRLDPSGIQPKIEMANFFI